MEGGIDLAERLYFAFWNQGSYEQALRAYERDMVPRVGKMVLQAREASINMQMDMPGL